MTGDNQRIVGVVRKLLHRSRSGDAAWSEVDNENGFIYKAPGVAVISLIAKVPGKDWAAPFVRILNAEGTMIAELSGAELDEKGWELLADLHAAARTNALGIGDTLDALERSLEDLTDYGPDEAPL